MPRKRKTLIDFKCADPRCKTSYLPLFAKGLCSRCWRNQYQRIRKRIKYNIPPEKWRIKSEPVLQPAEKGVS